MQLGMVGLGRMGANMTRRLMRNGHSLVVSDLSADAVKGLAGEGATGSSSIEDLISKLNPPRACAAFTTPKVYFWPGTGNSTASSQVICKNTPELGPPL